MECICQAVRKIRRAFGMTQVDLSAKSGVSLPTIQNIETGRANPSLATLESVLKPLGLVLEIRKKEADWDVLSALGLPLVSRSGKKVELDPDLLINQIRLAAMELDGVDRLPDHERKLESFQALLLALKVHYPSMFNKRIVGSSLLEALIPDRPSGRVIKLKRVVERSLSEYL